MMQTLLKKEEEENNIWGQMSSCWKHNTSQQKNGRMKWMWMTMRTIEHVSSWRTRIRKWSLKATSLRWRGATKNWREKENLSVGWKNEHIWKQKKIVKCTTSDRRQTETVPKFWQLMRSTQNRPVVRHQSSRWRTRGETRVKKCSAQSQRMKICYKTSQRKTRRCSITSCWSERHNWRTFVKDWRRSKEHSLSWRRQDDCVTLLYLTWLHLLFVFPS